MLKVIHFQFQVIHFEAIRHTAYLTLSVFHKEIHAQNITTQLLAILLHIWEVPYSNLDPETYPD